MAISMKCLKETAERFEILLPSGASVKSAAQAISDFFQENFTDMGECPSCGYASPEEDSNGEPVELCPFCGEDFSDDGGEPEEEEEEEAVEEEEEAEEEEEVKPTKKAPAKKAATEPAKKKTVKVTVEDESPTTAKTEKKSSKKVEPVKAEKKSSKKVEPKAEPKKPGRKPKDAAIVPAVEEHIVTPEQQAQLEAEIAAVHDLQMNRSQTTYKIGVHLVKICDANLWKGVKYDTVDDSGATVQKTYDTFANFVSRVFDISRQSAYKYMTCARTLTEDEYLKIGVKSGDLIASAPEKIQPQLKAAAIEGASHTELRRLIATAEGKPSAANQAAKNLSASTDAPRAPSVTLNSRAKEGDIIIPWLSAENHTPISRANVKNKYAKIDLTSEYFLMIVPNENGLDVTIVVKPIEKASEAPAIVNLG